MSYQFDYYIYRVEHGLGAVGQRAVDQRAGELAAALVDLRNLALRTFRRGPGAVRALARSGHPSREIAVTVAAAAER